MMDIEGAVVTIDAMGCQRVIAQTILDKKAEYVLALKGNQTALHEDVALFVAEQKERNFHECQISQNQTLDRDNGRKIGSASSRERVVKYVKISVASS